MKKPPVIRAACLVTASFLCFCLPQTCLFPSSSSQVVCFLHGPAGMSEVQDGGVWQSWYCLNWAVGKQLYLGKLGEFLQAKGTIFVLRLVLAMFLFQSL